MNKEGVVYDSRWKKTSGEVWVSVTRAAKIAYGFARGVGSAFVVAGLAGIIFTFKPVVTSELGYRVHRLTGPRPQEQIAQQAIEQAKAKEEEEKEEVRSFAHALGLPNSQFSIYIPKIDAKAQVLANVDPSSPGGYMDALSQGVAHAAGSVFPGMGGGTFLFAHSTDAPWNVAQYNAVFYLLRELEPASQDSEGDVIYVFFLDELYKYKVTEKHVVPTNDISWLTSSTSGAERLILQTCWPPGTTLKRLIIVAEPVDTP